MQISLQPAPQTKVAPIPSVTMQLALKLLAMSNIELAEHVSEELAENPVLEEGPNEVLSATELAGQGDKNEAGTTLDTTPAVDQQDATGDEDHRDLFGDYHDGYGPGTPTEDKQPPPIEQTLSAGTSLCEHLRRQLGEQTADDRLREIGEAIIGNLDRDGYLAESVDEIADMGPWPLPAVEQALALIQTLDPTGVAARDLQECLLLQIRDLGLAGTPCETIIRKHLPLLEPRRIPELARKLSISGEEIEECLDLISNLDPKPGSRLNAVEPLYVIPDVTVIQVQHDDYTVVLNDERIPRLRISPFYRRVLTENQSPEETRAYVKQKLKSAKWLIKSVEQRQRTICKVATSIIRFQRGFLDHGHGHLRPLTLQVVAEDVGTHPSTVSRVTAGKYIETPHGVFPMKYLFQTSVGASSEGEVSSAKVKERIRMIIAQEDPWKPLSDGQIFRLLKDEGFRLARRTIAKYRGELRIPTAILRAPRQPGGQCSMTAG